MRCDFRRGVIPLSRMVIDAIAFSSFMLKRLFDQNLIIPEVISAKVKLPEQEILMKLSNQLLHMGL